MTQNLVYFRQFEWRTQHPKMSQKQESSLPWQVVPLTNAVTSPAVHAMLELKLKGSRAKMMSADAMQCISFSMFLPLTDPLENCKEKKSCGIESRNHEGWKRALRSPRPTVSPSPACPLTTSLSASSTWFLEGLQGGFLPTERKKAIKLQSIGILMAQDQKVCLASTSAPLSPS